MIPLGVIGASHNESATSEHFREWVHLRGTPVVPDFLDLSSTPETVHVRIVNDKGQYTWQWCGDFYDSVKRWYYTDYGDGSEFWPIKGEMPAYRYVGGDFGPTGVRMYIWQKGSLSEFLNINTSACIRLFHSAPVDETAQRVSMLLAAGITP